jgi:hypothetical protein
MKAKSIIILSSFLVQLLNFQPDFAEGFAPMVPESCARCPSKRRNRNTCSRSPPFSRRTTTTKPTSSPTINQDATATSLTAASNNLPFAIVGADFCAPDLAAVCLGGSLLFFYHVRLFLKERNGERTWRREQADTREAWAKYVRDSKGWLYAIQTLRNAITAQTFLATTVLSLLTVIGGRLWEIVRQTATCGRRYAILQLILFAVPMISSAYYFLQSARLMTHAGFMFPVEPNTTKVDLIMRKTEHSQWLGLRCLYLSGGILSWVVGGSKVFVGTSLLLTMFFRKSDRAPMSMDYGEE